MSKVDTIVALKAQNKMLVELVKNISEGINQTRIDAINEAINSVLKILENKTSELDGLRDECVLKLRELKAVTQEKINAVR